MSLKELTQNKGYGPLTHFVSVVPSELVKSDPQIQQCATPELWVQHPVSQRQLYIEGAAQSMNVLSQT